MRVNNNGYGLPLTMVPSIQYCSLKFSWDIVFQVSAKDALLFGSAQQLERFVIFRAMPARSKHFAELIECNMPTAQ